MFRMLREVKEKTQQVEELQALLEDAQTELMKKQGQLHDAELSLKDDRERADALKIELGIAQVSVFACIPATPQCIVRCRQELTSMRKSKVPSFGRPVMKKDHDNPFCRKAWLQT